MLFFFFRRSAAVLARLYSPFSEHRLGLILTFLLLLWPRNQALGWKMEQEIV